MFTQILGQSAINLSASSEVLWGIKKLNLALVLDNTGSMAQSAKMTNLKTAAHNLLTTLQTAAKKPGDVQVAIVPFATDVNVGTGNVSASGSIGPNGTPPTALAARRHTPRKAPARRPARSGHPSHSTWNGCVDDRDQNNDVTNTAPIAGLPATLFRAHQAANCPASMMPLSYDWTALNSKIDAMTPTGNTNVTIGLAWGFQLISPVAPFNAPAPAVDLEKVIVILTDGKNTQNRWNSSAIDRRPHQQGLRQHQGRQHQALHRACDRWRHLAAARLRHQPRCITTCTRRLSSTACSGRSRKTSPISASRNSAARRALMVAALLTRMCAILGNFFASC